MRKRENTKRKTGRRTTDDTRVTKGIRERRENESRQIHSRSAAAATPFVARAHTHVGNSYDKCARSKPTKYFRTHKYTCTLARRVCTPVPDVRGSLSSEKISRETPLSAESQRRAHDPFRVAKVHRRTREYVSGGDTDDPENPVCVGSDMFSIRPVAPTTHDPASRTVAGNV